MPSFRLNDSSEPIISSVQQVLNEALYPKFELKTDGHAGPMTMAALAEYQRRNSYTELDETGHVYYGPKTDQRMREIIRARFYTDDHLRAAAKELKVSVSIIKAIDVVETKPCGFLPTGHPVVLFERHVFHRLLVSAKGRDFAAKVAREQPDICNPEPGGYLGGLREVARIAAASKVSAPLAMQSASWGVFQIMGMHYASLGYGKVEDMVGDAKASEIQHVKQFVKFCEHRGQAKLLEAMRKKDYASLARYYNGPSYARNQYDIKLATADAAYAWMNA